MNVTTFEQLPAAVQLLAEKLESIEQLILSREEQRTEAAPDELMTVEQASAFLSLSVPTIYSKTSKRELPYMKRGKRLYFSREELTEYLKAGRKPTNAQLSADAENYTFNQ